MARVSSPSGFSTLMRRLLSASVLAIGAAALLHAQVPGRNVNMVSGDKWPNGDPYLQRQNEPSLAASTRNPLHLLGGSNDYRTVDLPGLPGGGETGDAWLGLYRSFDGGQRWQSTLLPGYPQDTSAAGTASAMYGYQAGADPVVRPGTNGLFYYSGIVFDRTANGKSRVFVSRFIDNNNKEAGDGIHYLGSAAVASADGVPVPVTDGTQHHFIDKPWMAVDIPRPGAQTCNISTPGTPVQQVPAGAVYVAYAVITTTRDTQGATASVTGKIMFSRSLNCGVTWSTPIPVSDPADPINQGATIAVDPATGAVQLAWRRFGHLSTPDAVLTTRAMPGQQFPQPSLLRQTYSGRELGQVIKSIVGNRQTSATLQPESPTVAYDGNIAPFDQATTLTSFRTNSYPTMAIDGEGRVYVAWSERGFRGTAGGASVEDSSIVMTTGLRGAGWNQPFAVDLHVGPGHQLMPSLAFAGGKLMLAYYDLREDISGLFQRFVDEAAVKALGLKRHTVDLRAAQASPAAIPSFGVAGARSVRVSEYLVGSRPSSTQVEQLQFNPPNLPLFQLGEVPFLGDYVDIAPAPAFVQSAAGVWSYNTSSAAPPVFHTAWTDNRDVKPPTNGDWTSYTPPTGPQGASVFDPSKQVSACFPGKAGMRNQNVYTAKLTSGLMVGSPGNSKPLSTSLPRAFVVFAQNATDTFKWFRMTITAQPAGGWASFAQSGVAPLLLNIDVAVPARSTVSKSVFASSSNPDAQIPVSVVEISSGGGAPVSNGLTGTVILNPDISNPDISNPDISNPDISNPDISNAEVYNPDISNPDISNPDISNPDISNPDISNPDISNALILNPDISNPDISNPDISNPDISNPDISNPDISNPDISNGAITDYTWTVTNEGNTTSNYDVDLFDQANLSDEIKTKIKTQIIIHKTYTTPVSDGCVLKQQLQTVLVVNVVNPHRLPDGSLDLTLWLEPGGEGRVTLRVIDPDPADHVILNPVSAETPISPTVTSTAINTEDLGDPTATPPSATPPTAGETTTALSVLAQPITTVIEGSLGNVRVQLMRTENGATAPVQNAQVAVGIVTNPSGGHLAGQTTALTGANGEAVFQGLSIDRAGTGYRLLFTAASAGALPVTSMSFSVGTTAGADPDRNHFVVTATADSGPGSLRQAITNANNTANGDGGPDVISFGFRTTGAQRILLSTPLPPIGQPVIIDGTTQAGYNAVTGEPLVHIAGNGSNEFQGLIIQSSASNTVVRGLSLTGFGSPTSTSTTAAIQTAAAGVKIEGNWIGLSPTGLPMANQTGIWIRGGNPSIGGVGGAATRNVIAAGGTGIYAVGGTGAVIRGNFIGTSPDGLTAIGHSHLGINVQPGIDGMVIGGPLATGGYFAAGSPANLISGNAGGGIELQASFQGAGPANTQILGNIIGLSANGSDIGNNRFGIRAQSASGTQIGAVGAGNIISGNGAITTAPTNGENTTTLTTGRGVVISTSGALPAVMPIIRSNRIGVSIDGTQQRANLLEGVLLEAPAIIGGMNAGEGNLISGNGDQSIGGAGILAFSGAGGSVIQGNIVGLSSTGLALPNNSGIGIDGTTGGITIGGTGPGARNVVSGNRFGGINIFTNSEFNNPADMIISGNYIGTNTAGVVAGVGNGGFGISVKAGQGHVIGGDSTADGNVIAGNGAAGESGGVEITGAATRRVDVRSNSIFDNNGLGIDHGAQFGVSPNTPGGGTGGANDRQNFPVIDGVITPTDGGNALRATLDSSPGTYRIQVFRNIACDASGNGEGQTLVATTTLVMTATPAQTLIVIPALAAGQFVSATATDDEGNTSEFSNCATVQQPPVTDVSPVVQWTTANGGNGNYYQYVRVSGRSWSQAVDEAAARTHNGIRGRLVTIGSAAENQFVNSLRGVGDADMRAWIGFYDPDGEGGRSFEWITGEAVTYTNWNTGTGEPNNLNTEFWVEMFRDTTWNNITNSGTAGPSQGYVVEYQAAVPPPTEAVTGNLTFNSPNVQVGSWTQGAPQTFRLTVDMDAKTTSLTINGVAVGSATFNPTSEALGSVSVELGTTGTQRFAWDDILVRDAVGSTTRFRADFSSDALGQPPSTPPVGTWTIPTGNSGPVLVRAEAGGIATQPVELAQNGSGTNLLGNVVTPPATGVWVVEWKSAMADPGTGPTRLVFAPIVIRDTSGGIIASVEYR